MKPFKHYFWWMDQQDPRVRGNFWARLAYSVFWVLGLLFLILFSQFVIRLFAHFGFTGGAGS